MPENVQQRFRITNVLPIVNLLTQWLLPTAGTLDNRLVTKFGCEYFSSMHLVFFG